ncbi:MAG: hypothetical protein WCT18_04055, partial [Patescibacteria group bacterium]
FLFFLGYRPFVLKNFQISFSLIIEGNKVFSPLRYENDLFIRGKYGVPPIGGTMLKKLTENLKHDTIQPV